MRDLERRRQRNHERYLEKREEILAKQKLYRETHKEEIKQRRRERNFVKVYLNPKKPAKTRSELNHSYYMRHREEILAKWREKYYARRE